MEGKLIEMIKGVNLSFHILIHAGPCELACHVSKSDCKQFTTKLANM
jgi:hypothetical protein